MTWMIPDILIWMMAILQNAEATPLEAAMRIEGSVALVIGANRGIGKAITTALLDRGAAKVYAAVRDVSPEVPNFRSRLIFTATGGSATALGLGSPSGASLLQRIR